MAAIDERLVEALLREQFPQWASLPVRRVHPGGWDNATFRVGDALVARLPNDDAYAAQVAIEAEWLPRLAAHLPVAVPEIVAVGAPTRLFPRPWSVRRWIEGEPARIPLQGQAAREIAGFLHALHLVPTDGAPAPGAINFHRGGGLSVYANQVRTALVVLEGRVDVQAAARLWREATASRWDRAPVWVHGDLAPGNLLLREGRLAAVIDFGQLAVGDPACDLALAWTSLQPAAREVFVDAMKLDAATWTRAKAWVLWKALIVAAGLSPTNGVEYSDPLAVVREALR